MKIEHSFHWEKQRKFRPDITDDVIELCITLSSKIKDREWIDAWNAISKIPQSGRTLKVVYRDKGKTIKIITAFWLD